MLTLDLIFLATGVTRVRCFTWGLEGPQPSLSIALFLY